MAKLMQALGLLVTIGAAIWFFVAYEGTDRQPDIRQMLFALLTGCAGIIAWLGGRAVAWWSRP